MSYDFGLSDRENIDAALAEAVDFVQPGNVCCQGCYPIPDTAVTYAVYTGQDVERAFSDDGRKPVGERSRWSSDDDEYEDEGAGTVEYPAPHYADADQLVAPLYIGYGMRDASVWTEDGCTAVRLAVVEALRNHGFEVEDPGTNDTRIQITGVTKTVHFA